MSRHRAQLRDFLHEIQHRGWTVTKTRRNHFRLSHPCGALLFTGGTPSCVHAVANIRAAVRRAEKQEKQS